MVTAMAAPAPEVEDRRIDWFSGTYGYLPRLGEPEPLIWCRQAAAALGPLEEWTAPRPGRHFGWVSSHPCGLVVQRCSISCAPRKTMEAPDHDLLSISVSGNFWSSLSAEDAPDTLLQLLTMEGYRNTTRLDHQITVVHPVVDAEEFGNEVQAGRLWPRGFSRTQDYRETDHAGQTVGNRTTYFGSKQSDKRVRVYDKGGEDNRDDETIRFEIQLRADRANAWATTFREEAEREYETTGCVRLAEARTVTGAMAQEFDLRDTSRWAGRERPKDWARSAPQPDWWAQLIAEAEVGRQVQPRRVVDLDSAVETMLTQYGRKLGLWLLQEATRTGSRIDEVAEGLAEEALRRVNEEDLATFLDTMPATEAAAHRQALREFDRPYPGAPGRLP